MDSESDQHPALSPGELAIRLAILDKMTHLHARISDALTHWAESIAVDNGATCAQVTKTLLREVTDALEEAYRRRLHNCLHPLEQEHWVPALEEVRQELREASASLSRMPGAQLLLAIERLRQSSR